MQITFGIYNASFFSFLFNLICPVEYVIGVRTSNPWHFQAEITPPSYRADNSDLFMRLNEGIYVCKVNYFLRYGHPVCQ